MERQMRLHEDVLRYLTIRVDALEEGPSVMMQAKSGRDDDRRGGRGRRDDRRGERDERRGDREERKTERQESSAEGDDK
jgi:small subunit ribosomal protein S6